MLARRPKWRDQMAGENCKLVAITRTVLRQGQTVAQRLAVRIRRNSDAKRVRVQLQRALEEIRRVRPFVRTSGEADHTTGLWRQYPRQ